MLHESRHVVYYDARALSDAQPGEKREMLGTLLDGMLAQDVIAGNTAYCLGTDLTGVSAENSYGPISYATETSHGKFTPYMSLKLIRNMQRLDGFISAIKRWPEQEAVVDVGSGSFPILALAAAVYHPGAHVNAIEINPDAADAAAKIAEAFGMQDRVEIINSDIAKHPVDANTTAAVTETFNAGLQEEPGPKIVRMLHNSGVPVITPSTAELRLTMPSGKFFQGIDLRRDTHAEIAFDGWDQNTDELRKINISAAYYDDFGIVLPYDADIISSALNYRTSPDLQKAMSDAGGSGHITYELGAHPFEPKVKEQQLAA